MISTIQLTRNVGTFDSVSSGAQLPFNRFALVYAENGRGKTTLSAILRSLKSGDPQPIIERTRLGSQNPPHIVISDDTSRTSIFQSGVWTNFSLELLVFDDHFVSENIFSGMQVDTGHRQKLYELIIGARGVALNNTLQTSIDRVEQHNRDLQLRSGAIPAESRGGLNVDAFCALEEEKNIDEKIQEIERNLNAVNDAEAVRKTSHFQPIPMPAFDINDLEKVLLSGLPQLEQKAANQVKMHFDKIGKGGETWVNDGMRLFKIYNSEQDHKACPFCAQNVEGSELINHYQSYFSAEYIDLRKSIDRSIQKLNLDQGRDAQTLFERALNSTIQIGQFWARFTNIQEVKLDPVKIISDWKQVYDVIFSLLDLKQKTPLEIINLPQELLEKNRFISFLPRTGNFLKRRTKENSRGD